MLASSHVPRGAVKERLASTEAPPDGSRRKKKKKRRREESGDARWERGRVAAEQPAEATWASWDEAEAAERSWAREGRRAAGRAERSPGATEVSGGGGGEKRDRQRKRTTHRKEEEKGESQLRQA